MFELLKSYAYQHSKEFDIDDLKELLMAENYVNFKDFRRRILEPAIAEINEYTELSVKYNKRQEGCKSEVYYQEKESHWKFRKPKQNNQALRISWQ